MNEIIQSISSIFSLDSSHVFWFITRSAGIMAYLLLWLSTVWGLAVSAKPFDRFLPRLFTFDAHEFLSLLALGFTAVHVIVLMFDSFEPFSLMQLFIPFTGDYRPLWTALGIVALDLAVLVTVTFYLRQRIGFRTFRILHYLSFASYIGATLHGIFAGTDTSLGATQLMYLETALVVVVLTAYMVRQHSGRRGIKPQPLVGRGASRARQEQETTG